MDWRFSTFLLLMFGLLFGFTWATSETGLCSSEYVLAVLQDETKDGALNCFEFWFNRYQTMLTGCLALLAAWAAWIGVGRQIKRSDRQNAITLIPILSKRKEAADSVHSSIDAINNERRVAIYWLEMFIRGIGPLLSAAKKQNTYEQSISRNRLSIPRDNHSASIQHLSDAVSKYKININHTIMRSSDRRDLDSYIQRIESFIDMHRILQKQIVGCTDGHHISDDVLAGDIESLIVSARNASAAHNLSAASPVEISLRTRKRFENLLDEALLEIEA